MTTRTLTSALLIGVVLLSACSTPQVQVWERGNLASRVMERDSSATQSALEQHAYTSKEATAGGYGVGAGGCGCN